jgi:hypothetical protein
MCGWIKFSSFNIDYIFKLLLFLFFDFEYQLFIFFCDFFLHLENWCLIVGILSFVNQSFSNSSCTHLISFDNFSKINLISFLKMLNYFWQNVTLEHIKLSKHVGFWQQVESIICCINLHNSLIT